MDENERRCAKRDSDARLAGHTYHSTTMLSARGLKNAWLLGFTSWNGGVWFCCELTRFAMDFLSTPDPVVPCRELKPCVLLRPQALLYEYVNGFELKDASGSPIETKSSPLVRLLQTDAGETRAFAGEEGDATKSDVAIEHTLVDTTIKDDSARDDETLISRQEYCGRNVKEAVEGNCSVEEGDFVNQSDTTSETESEVAFEHTLVDTTIKDDRTGDDETLINRKKRCGRNVKGVVERNDSVEEGEFANQSDATSETESEVAIEHTLADTTIKDDCTGYDETLIRRQERCGRHLKEVVEGNDSVEEGDFAYQSDATSANESEVAIEHTLVDTTIKDDCTGDDETLIRRQERCGRNVKQVVEGNDSFEEGNDSVEEGDFVNQSDATSETESEVAFEHTLVDTTIKDDCTGDDETLIRRQERCGRNVKQVVEGNGSVEEGDFANQSDATSETSPIENCTKDDTAGAAHADDSPRAGEESFDNEGKSFDGVNTHAERPNRDRGARQERVDGIDDNEHEDDASTLAHARSEMDLEDVRANPASDIEDNVEDCSRIVENDVTTQKAGLTFTDNFDSEAPKVESDDRSHTCIELRSTKSLVEESNGEIIYPDESFFGNGSPGTVVGGDNHGTGGVDESSTCSEERDDLTRTSSHENTSHIGRGACVDGVGESISKPICDKSEGRLGSDSHSATHSRHQSAFRAQPSEQQMESQSMNVNQKHPKSHGQSDRTDDHSTDQAQKVVPCKDETSGFQMEREISVRPLHVRVSATVVPDGTEESFMQDNNAMRKVVTLCQPCDIGVDDKVEKPHKARGEVSITSVKSSADQQRIASEADGCVVKDTATERRIEQDQGGRVRLGLCGTDGKPKIELQTMLNMRSGHCEVFDSVPTVVPILWKYGTKEENPCFENSEHLERSFQECMSQIQKVLKRVQLTDSTPYQNRFKKMLNDNCENVPTFHSVTSAHGKIDSFFKYQHDGMVNSSIFAFGGRVAKFIQLSVEEEYFDKGIRDGKYDSQMRNAPKGGEPTAYVNAVRSWLHNFNLVIDVAYSLAEAMMSCGESPFEYRDLLVLPKLLGGHFPTVALPQGYSIQRLMPEKFPAGIDVLEIPGVVAFQSQVQFMEHERLRWDAIRSCRSLLLITSADSIGSSMLDGQLVRLLNSLCSRRSPNQNDDDCKMFMGKVVVIVANGRKAPPVLNDARTIHRGLDSDRVFQVDTTTAVRKMFVSDFHAANNRLPCENGDDLEKMLHEFLVSNHTYGEVSPATLAERFEKEGPCKAQAALRTAMYSECHLSRISSIYDGDISRDTLLEKEATYILNCLQRTLKDHLKIIKYVVFPMFQRDYQFSSSGSFVPSGRLIEACKKLRDVHMEKGSTVCDPFCDGIRNVYAIHMLWKIHQYLEPMIQATSSSNMETSVAVARSVAIKSVSSNTLRFESADHSKNWKQLFYSIVLEEFPKYLSIECSQSLMNGLFPALMERIRGIPDNVVSSEKRMQVMSECERTFHTKVNYTVVSFRKQAHERMKKVLFANLSTEPNEVPVSEVVRKTAIILRNSWKALFDAYETETHKIIGCLEGSIEAHIR